MLWGFPWSAHISVASPSIRAFSSELSGVKTSPAETLTQLRSSATNIVE